MRWYNFKRYGMLVLQGKIEDVTALNQADKFLLDS